MNNLDVFYNDTWKEKPPNDSVYIEPTCDVTFDNEGINSKLSGYVIKKDLDWLFHFRIEDIPVAVPETFTYELYLRALQLLSSSLEEPALVVRKIITFKPVSESYIQQESNLYERIKEKYGI